jgi:4-oxalocrotonate tautomerase
MPYVLIQITDRGLTAEQGPATAEQKAALIEGVTDLLRDVLAKPAHTTMVVIDECPPENWGMGGRPVLDYLARERSGANVDEQ